MNRLLSTCIFTIAALLAFVSSASADDSDIWDDIELVYVVETGWVYRDFISGTDLMWFPELTTTSYHDAETMYDLLMLALEHGELKSILDPDSSNSPSDVRIRTEYWKISRPTKLRPNTVLETKSPPSLAPLPRELSRYDGLFE